MKQSKDKKMGRALRNDEMENQSSEKPKKSGILEGIDSSIITESNNEMNKLLIKWLGQGHSMNHINKQLDEIAKNPPESMKMISVLAEKIRKKIKLS